MVRGGGCGSNGGGTASRDPLTLPRDACETYDVAINKRLAKQKAASLELAKIFCDALEKFPPKEQPGKIRKFRQIVAKVSRKKPSKHVSTRQSRPQSRTLSATR